MLFYAFGLNIDSDLDFSSMLLKGNGVCSLVIKKGIVPLVKYEPTKVFRKGVQAQVGLEKELVYLHWEGIVTCQIRNGNEILYQTYDENIETVKLFLMSEAIGIALAQRGYYLLHGSAVKIKDKAHVYIGIPGAGKSTTAAAFWKQNQTVLSDDLVAITFKNESAFVEPAFPQFKVWGQALSELGILNGDLKPSFEGSNKYMVSEDKSKFPSTSIPLESITILTPLGEKLNSVNALNSSTEFLKHYPLPHQILAETRLQQHFVESIALTTAVSVRMIHRPDGFGKLKEFVKLKIEAVE